MHISDELVDLREMTIAAYLFGSQTKSHDLRRDVDLLFVIADDSMKMARWRMREIQSLSGLLFHPTFVSETDMRNNPYFSKIVDRAIKLW
jgi:hypothetical protein